VGPSAPPIILISVDTLRADHLGCYGYKRVGTPRIDRIANGGTLFSQASAQVPLTLPSHASLLTSTYPFFNGVEDNGERLAPNAMTLARALKERGYRTAAFVGSFVLNGRFGLDQGFDVYDAPGSGRTQAGKDPGDVKRIGEEVVEAAIHWLDGNSSGPFFLFVHLYDLHTPYTLPASHRPLGTGYDAELTYTDEVLGRFMATLEQRGLMRKSILAFTSDHGESLHEHGESTHGYFIYQSTLHVPLIIHWPDSAQSLPARVAEPVNLLDIAPTLLEAAGIPVPHDFQGRSLLRPASSSGNFAGAEEIYGESLYGHSHFGTSALRTLRLGRYKYIQAPHPELYDLDQDPTETENLYDSQKSVAMDLRRRLLSLRQAHRAQRGAVPRAALPETVQHLQSLGYLAGGAARRSADSPDAGPDPKDRIAEYEKFGEATVLAASGRLQASDAVLERLLEKDGNLLDVRTALGLNQQRLGHHDEATRSFREVLKRDPLNVVAHFNLAVSTHALGRDEDAARELEATLALAPYYVRAEEMLASIQLAQQNYQSARTHLTRALAIDAASYGANYDLGTLDCVEGRWADGERHLRAAILSDPGSAEAHNTLGSLLLQRRELDAARAEFLEALRLNPQFADAHYNLGLVFNRQQNSEEAAREFREALAVNPRFRPARAALDRLNGNAGKSE
jgi:tetratricopeptide (TPR) repeat protein